MDPIIIQEPHSLRSTRKLIGIASDWELLENSKAAMNEGSSTIAEGDTEVGNHERP